MWVASVPQAGRVATPPLFDVMVAIGYEITIDRLKAATVLATALTSEE